MKIKNLRTLRQLTDLQVIFFALLLILIGVIGTGYTMNKNHRTKSSENPTQSTTNDSSDTAGRSSGSVDLTNWHEYSNDRHQYKVKYPTSWKIKKQNEAHIQFYDPDSKPTYTTKFLKKIQNPDEPAAQIDYYNALNDLEQTGSKTTAKTLNEFFENNKDLKEKHRIEFSGRTAYAGFISKPRDAYVVYAQQNDHIYILTIYGPSVRTNMVPQDRGIVNTFKFGN
jgi:hypothetical protein